MNVAVIGTGYVGLVSGVCLAAKGHQVTCVDVRADLVDKLNAGLPPIYEPGLEALLQEVLSTQHFCATIDLQRALERCNVVMIAVGTPSTKGIIDLTHVREAARAIGLYMKATQHRPVVIVKSTVIPGTTDGIVKAEIEAASDLCFPAFGLGMNPEFLREGEALEDFMEPDRLVLGYEDAQSLACLEELYAPWHCDKVCVNTRTAELIKYANNALLATQISAMNEIANFAAALGGVDIMDVVHGVTLDKRWNPIVAGERLHPPILTYLKPGCGFGGSCFPKDVQAIRAQGMSLGLEMSMLNAVLTVNEKQCNQVVNMLEKHVGSLFEKHCLVLGLAFKPGTDDVRESMSVRMIDSLVQRGVNVVAHDPVAADNFVCSSSQLAKDVRVIDDWQSYILNVDIIIIATSWPEYRALQAMDITNKIIFDARRMFNAAAFPLSHYLAIGRSVVSE